MKHVFRFEGDFNVFTWEEVSNNSSVLMRSRYDIFAELKAFTGQWVPLGCRSSTPHMSTHVLSWNSICADGRCVSRGHLSSLFPCSASLLPWTGLVQCRGLCIAIGDSRPGPGASPLWHTFSAAPPAWLSLLSKGGWCTFREKQTNMEAMGVQVYRPCSFDYLWVWHLRSSDVASVHRGTVYQSPCVN